MAFPTSVNSQITDAVTQANTKTLGDAPAIATGNFMIATSQALQNAAHNSTSGQQQASVTAQAALTQGVSTLYSIDTASAAVSTNAIYRKTNASDKTISAECVIGAVYEKTASPVGKKDLARAVAQANNSLQANDSLQANECLNADNDYSALRQLQESIEAAISDALKAGLSKQSVAHYLISALEEQNISMLYPFDTEGKTITEKDIQDYYSSVVDDYYSTQTQLRK